MPMIIFRTRATCDPCHLFEKPHAWRLSLKANVDILQQYQGYIHIVAVSFLYRFSVNSTSIRYVTLHFSNLRFAPFPLGTPLYGLYGDVPLERV